MGDEIERNWESAFCDLPASAADEVLCGLVRLRNGQRLTTRQSRALSRWQRSWLSAIRESLYAALPTQLWQKSSGCRRQQIDEQGQTYGLPIAGKTINLPALARALHRFIAEHWTSLRAAKDDGVGAPAEPASPELERWRRARADMAELDLEQRRGDLVDRREFQALLLRTAHILRGLGESLQRQYGPDAQGLLDEAIDDVEREVQRHFARYESNGKVNGDEHAGVEQTDDDPAE